MSDRFSGANRKQRLQDALADQEIVAGNFEIARDLAESAEIIELNRGQQLFARHQTRSPVMYFIISGCVKLSVEDRIIATLKAKQSLGEFPILDFSFATHQVSAEAVEPTTVAVVPGERFSVIAEQFPLLWKAIARSLAVRLDERNKLVAASQLDLDKITIKQIWQNLTVKQFAGIVGFLIAIAIGAFTLGQHFPGIVEKLKTH